MLFFAERSRISGTQYFCSGTPTLDVSQAIMEASQSVNVTQLKSFLGMLSNLSTHLAPLYGLLKKNSH